MKVVIDIETNSLNNPSKLWLVVCRCVESGELFTFRDVSNDEKEQDRFLQFSRSVTQWIGHNIVEYDLPHLARLVSGFDCPPTDRCIDTLILSRLVNYSREGGHSLEQYGKELGFEKIKYNDFTKYSPEMELYCVRDVEITDLIYRKYLRIILDPSWLPAIGLEHRFQLIVNDLHNNGFGFNTARAGKLLERVSKELNTLDEKILEAFPPREVLIREFIPKATKHGTISKTSVPRSLWETMHLYEVGKTYRHTRMEPFNPSSHKQLIAVLNEAGWKPENKTTTHINTERELNQLKRSREKDAELDLKIELLDNKLQSLRDTGWKVDEQNLSTLPETAPPPARFLAKRILLEARRRSLVEQLGCVQDDRIHGKFVGIGSWPHRMAHQHPNTANIPTAIKMDGSPKLLGKEMRELWCAPRNRLLVGVDAEGIQLRIFAHIINDPEFTRALVEGKKDDKTDPHSLNQSILGSICKSREAAKRFIYALLLGGGLDKLAKILECSVPETKEALNRLMERYTGFATVKQKIIPADAQRGYFIGLDGRKVRIPGETVGERRHLAMSGYLQNGESIVIKRAAILTSERLEEEKVIKNWMFVDIVHDEFVMEIRNDMGLANKVKKISSDAIAQVGVDLKLRCPLAGSGGIGHTWYNIH